MRLLATFFLDSGTFRFCDDVVTMSDGTNNYIGASALAGATDIKSSAPYAAESVTITVDGTRISQTVSDPAALFQTILQDLLSNRRVDLAWGLSWPDAVNFSIVIPLFAGKINNAKVTDSAVQLTDVFSGGQGSPKASNSQLIITLDSLAMRYQYGTNRVRSHQDQQELHTGDNFFKFVGNTIANSHNLYWGRAAPNGSLSGVGGTGGSVIGGNGSTYQNTNFNIVEGLQRL